MEGLRAHLGLPRAKDGDEDFGQAMPEGAAAVSGSLLRGVDGDVAELVLAATV